MTDRLAIILASNAAQCMPKVAAFLANEPALPAATVEAALQAAAVDAIGAKHDAETRDAWSQAVASANGHYGEPAASSAAATAEGETSAKTAWGKAIAMANAGAGAD